MVALPNLQAALATQPDAEPMVQPAPRGEATAFWYKYKLKAS